MTAYGMRVSDWSSDVCSSDLVREYAHHESEAGRTPEGWKLVGKRPNRKFRDENTAIETLRLVHEVEDEHLYDPPKFKSPAKVEAALRQHYGLKGKKATEAIADLVTSVSRDRKSTRLNSSH